MQSNGLSDKEIMLLKYANDSENAITSQPTVAARDPHKKRNAIFNFASDDLKSNSGSAVNSNVSSPSSKMDSTPSSITNRPGIDDTVLTDTMKQFLDKSVKQALEDSHRRAMEEGSPFIITPAIEKHLRNLSPGDEMLIDSTIKRWKNDTDVMNRKSAAGKQTKVGAILIIRILFYFYYLKMQ